MNAKVDEITAELTGSFVAQLQEQITKQVQADIARKLGQIDITAAINEAVDRRISNLVSTLSFPDGSIPGPAVNLQKFLISGDNVSGGIIENFGSTGIQDAATDCRVTILDDATVVENKLITSELEVKGDLTLNGNLIVAGDLQQRLIQQVSNGVTSELSTIDLPKTVQDLAARSADSYIKSLQAHIKQEVDITTANIKLVDVIKEVATSETELLVQSLSKQVTSQVQADIARMIGTIDIRQQVREYVASQLSDSIQSVNFPERSIPGLSINADSLVVSGDNVRGGVIPQFKSTGIHDNAASLQVIITDDVVSIGNKLVAGSADIKGNLVVDGDIILTGEIPSNSPFYTELVQHAAGLLKLSLNDEFFLQYANLVYDKIKEDGVDLAKVTLNQKEIVSGNRLGRSITDTNIQKLGELKTLFVRGEASLASSLYALNKRVGINTQDPSSALAVWDDECEVVTKKLRKDVAIVGTLREQRLVLSANNKENLTLEIDGSVTVDRINLGNSGPTMQIGSTPARPVHNDRKGVILFNSNPEVGSPAFWISLGGARWVDGPLIS